MTRINTGVHPAELCDKHLVAEYRELPYVWSLAVKCAKRGMTTSPVPSFRLGHGHMLFFVDKGRYLQARWAELYQEMLYRGYRPQLSWRAWPPDLNRPWMPTKTDLHRARVEVRSRILYRLTSMRGPKWTGRDAPAWATTTN